MFSGCGGLGTTAYALPGAIKVHAAAGSNSEHGSCDDVGEESASSQRRQWRCPPTARAFCEAWAWHRASFSAGLVSGLRQGDCAICRSTLPLPTRQRSGLPLTLQALCKNHCRDERSRLAAP